MKKILLLLALLAYPVHPMALQFGDGNTIELTVEQSAQLKAVSKTIADLANDLGTNEPIPLAFMNRGDFERLLLPMLPHLSREDGNIQDVGEKILSIDDLKLTTCMAAYLNIGRLKRCLIKHWDVLLSSDDAMNSLINNTKNFLQQFNVPDREISEELNECLLVEDAYALTTKFFDLPVRISLLGSNDPFTREVQWSFDGNFLAELVGYGSQSSTRIWDVRTNQIKQTVPSTYLTCWQPQGMLLAAISTTRHTIVIWDIETGQEKYQLMPNNRKQIFHADWDKEGKQIFVHYEDRTEQVWDIETEVSKTFDGDSDTAWDTTDDNSLFLQNYTKSYDEKSIRHANTGKRVYSFTESDEKGLSFNLIRQRPNSYQYAFYNRDDAFAHGLGIRMHDLKNIFEMFKASRKLKMPQVMLTRYILRNKKLPWLHKAETLSQNEELLKCYFNDMPYSFRKGAMDYVGLPLEKPSRQSFMHALKPSTIANAALKAIGWKNKE